MSLEKKEKDEKEEKEVDPNSEMRFKEGNKEWERNIKWSDVKEECGEEGKQYEKEGKGREVDPNYETR